MAENKRQNRILWAGLSLAAISLLSFALDRTAIPVVIDMPLASLAIVVPAAIALLAGIRGELSRPAGASPVPIALGSVALIAVLFIGASAIQQRFLSYRASEAVFNNNGVRLVGTIYRPRSSGKYPGVAFIHGSGPETRTEYAYFAKLFARNNFAALVYDKRGAGQSTGRLYESDYLDYAKDALASVQFLRESEGVDPGCIGLIGFSEGEWVAPLAASLSEHISFLAVVGPSGVSPAQQVNEEIKLRLLARGYSEADVQRALALNGRVFEYQRTGLEKHRLAADLEAASKTPWFQDAQDIPAQLYHPEAYRWWRSVMDYSPGPVWAQIVVPTLVLKGGKDANSTAELAKQEIEGALLAGGNQDLDFVFFPEGDHALLRWPFGEGVPPPLFAKGYLETMVQWTANQPCANR